MAPMFAVDRKTRPLVPPRATGSVPDRPDKTAVNALWSRVSMSTSAHASATPAMRASEPAVSSPGDAHEREADEVADRVVRKAAPSPIGAAPSRIQRTCTACEDEDTDTIQTKRASSAGAEAGLDPAAAARAADRGGQPLPGSLRSWFEPRFGHGLGPVRLHTDSEAAAGARAVQARAYTIGNDIVFGAGEYQPATPDGRRLLAHELTHTVQQSALPRGGTGSIHRLIQRSCSTAAGKVVVVADGKPCTHTVVVHDTLYSLGLLYGVTVDEIKTANTLTSNTITPGQVLTIPIAGGAGTVSYTVKSKETLYSIAKKHGVSVADIQKANGMKGTDIKAGQTILIPVKGGAAAPAKTPTPSTSTPTPTSPPAKATPPAAKTPATPPPAATPAAASTSADSGHDPGKDYAGGTMREDSYLRKSDRKTIQTSGGAQLFFQKGATVTRKSSTKEWVEVEGPVFKSGKPPVAAGTGTGWIKRVWTTMTLGDYKDVPVDDRTDTYGGLSTGALPKADVNSVILHQTGSSTGAGTLSDYSGRIKAGKTVGAHYLIDETGKIILTVPVDQGVSHVGKTKPGFSGSSNSHAIGIEHAGAETALDLPSSAKDTTTLKANRATIKAMALSPDLKQRLLDMTDAELYAIARDNRDPHADDKAPKTPVKKWYLYGDINAAQKRSSFLLTQKLMADFGLAEADLLPHETVSWKTIGEGENIKEYLTARSAYPALVTKLDTLVKGDPKLAGDTALAKIVADEKATVAALAVDATEAENKALATEKAGTAGVATARETLRTSFYDKFWARQTQLADLVKFLTASGSTKPTELAAKLKAWVT